MFREIKSYKSFFTTNINAILLLLFVFCLISVGLISMSSASLSFINKDNFLNKQLLWLSIGIVTFILGLSLDLDIIKKHTSIIFCLSIILLVIVLIPGIGKTVNGSRRWISLGGINIQISEFAKFSVILWLSNYIAINIDKIKSLKYGFIKPLCICGIVSMLIFLEPDYGSAVLIGGLSLTMLFLAGTRFRYLLIATVMSVTVVSLLVLVSPVRLRRISSFLDIDNNKLEGAYQLWQGILGFAAGGINGQGIGQGRQQLTFLPESHTDFIFAIIGEELGAITTISIVIAFALFFTICMIRSLKINDIFRQKLCQGTGILITLQAMINMGVATGLLPTKGMSLPFVSYGGSSLALMLFLVGVLLNTLNISVSTENNS